jgi:hypothetical protein
MRFIKCQKQTPRVRYLLFIYLDHWIDYNWQLYYSFHPSIGYFCSISKMRFALTQFEVKQEMRWPSLLWLRKAALKAALCFSRIKSIFCKIGTFRVTFIDVMHFSV